MNAEEQLEKIIENHLPALENGLETVDSILNLYPKDASDLRPRLEAALWLAEATKSLEPRPGFISSTRSHIEKRVTTMPRQNTWQGWLNRYSPPRWLFNLVSPMILVALVVLILNSLVLSARLSIPGDPLYSTKLALEEIQLAFTFNAEDKTDLYIQFSRERTTEFVNLVLEGDYNQLPSAAARMETDIIYTIHSVDAISSTEPGSEFAKVNQLRETLANEVIMLNILKNTSPPSAHTGIDLAIHVAQSGILALH